MVESGLLGDKTQKGFYQKTLGPQGTEILTLDYNTMEYVSQRKPELPLLDELRKEGDLAAGLQRLVYSDDRTGRFAWKALKRMLLYSASKVPEIADDIVSIDRAMRWGFNWELGPFETWDAIGLKESVERMEKEGDTIPENVERMLQSGRGAFYEKRDGTNYFYDFQRADYAGIRDKPEIILLPSLKERTNVIKSNAGASLIDMGDGVACLELTTANRTIDPDVIQMMFDSVAEVEENFEGLVIGNQGVNFCVGVDLKRVFPAAQNKEWDALDKMLHDFQLACMRVKYSEKPVVAAPFRMALGGGCEICMSTSMVRAHVECYIGLVEFGVGVIPVGGGCKEMVLRATDWVPSSIPSAVPGGGKPDLLPYVARTFETIAMAKVSTCAQEAKDLGYMTPYDKVTMNWDHLLYDAKQSVLSLAGEGYRPPRPRDEIRVTGRTGRGLLELLVYLLKEGLYISEHDAVVAKKLANVLTGGDVDQNTLVTEEYLLELEREACMSLCGEEKTQARMKHMIETGKPLRN
jgi:3-hydroxyacyl-CoA dehydrogenase